MSRDSFGWPRYIPVAEQRLKALKKVGKLRKKGMEIYPVEIEGRKIARTFWGSGWCSHLESFSDYANRLPRGRSYVRNGFVCHLAISEGIIEAIVCGTRLYNVKILVEKLPEQKWQQLKKQCAGQIGSILELLQGKLAKNIMTVVADREKGLFPLPAEIVLSCDCPDWADMCKHVAATLYGVGRRLDEQPELLFLLRGANLDDLITEGAEEALTARVGSSKKGKIRRIADTELEAVFGIDLGGEGNANEAAEDEDYDHCETAPDLRQNRDRSECDQLQDKQALAKSKKQGLAEKKRIALVEKINYGKLTGKAVAGLRSDYKMSQNEFARLIGVSVATISTWEKSKGTLNLQARTRKALLDALGATD